MRTCVHACMLHIRYSMETCNMIIRTGAYTQAYIRERICWLHTCIYAYMHTCVHACMLHMQLMLYWKHLKWSYAQVHVHRIPTWMRTFTHICTCNMIIHTVHTRTHVYGAYIHTYTRKGSNAYTCNMHACTHVMCMQQWCVQSQTFYMHTFWVVNTCIHTYIWVNIHIYIRVKLLG
jgi:hypothetical protein